MLSPLAVKMLIIMSIVALIGCVLSFIFFAQALNIVYGILAGTAVSVFRFWLLEKSLTKSLSLGDASKSRAFAGLAYSGRFLLTIALLVFLAFNHPTINLGGVIYGTLNMQVSAYICGILINRESKNNANQGQ